MTRYVTSFKDAGYAHLAHVKVMQDDDLTKLGVNLIGHRNKISKSIKKIKKELKVEDNFKEGEEEVFV